MNLKHLFHGIQLLRGYIGTSLQECTRIVLTESFYVTSPGIRIDSTLGCPKSRWFPQGLVKPNLLSEGDENDDMLYSYL